jgi:hypothetical protein
MAIKQDKPPRGLGAHGRRLWRSVAAELAEDGLILTAIERIWLGSACKLVDQAAAVEAELAGAPVYMTGSMGQQVANPLLGELRQLHLAINQTLARIKTDVPEEAPAIVPGVNQARAAIHTRWRGA